MSDLKCPGCGNTDQRMIAGIVYPHIYDGVVVWDCQKCGREWRRFPPSYERINRALDAIYERSSDG